MKVLITGSLGQLGTELLNTSCSDHTICSVDVKELDITVATDVDNFVHELKPQLIINAAAYTAVDKAETEEEIAFKINCEGPANLAKAAQSINARMIHVSTDYVFNGTGSQPYRPEDATNPIGAYGRTKLAGEQAVQDFCRDSIIIRTAWLYSVRGNNFVKTMLRLMAERQELGVVADQIGTPTSAGTLANVIWKFAQNPQLVGIYHWTDAGVASWYDFAYAIMKKGFELGLLDHVIYLKPIRTIDYPMPAKRPGYSVLDKTKTYQDLKIKPEHWSQALTDTLCEMKD